MTTKTRPSHIAPDDRELYGTDAPRIQRDRAAEDVPPTFEENAPIWMVGL